MPNSIRGHKACESIVVMIVVPTVLYQLTLKSVSVPTEKTRERGPFPPSKSLKEALFRTIKTAVLMN